MGGQGWGVSGTGRCGRVGSVLGFYLFLHPGFGRGGLYLERFPEFGIEGFLSGTVAKVGHAGSISGSSFVLSATAWSPATGLPGGWAAK